MATTVTGSIKNLSGGVVAAGTVTFTLTGFGEQLPRVLSSAIIAPFQVSVLTDGSGNFTVLLYGNDVIDPPGTLYGVELSGTGAAQIGPYLFNITGTGVDLDTQPQATPFVPTVPTGILSTNNTWTGTNAFGAATTFNALVSLLGLVNRYNNIATVAGGIPSEVASVDLTAATAAVGTTTLYAVPGAGTIQHRLSWNAKVVTPAGTSSTLGPLTITYVDPNSVTQTITAAAQISAGTIASSSTGNTNTTVLQGVPLLLNCKGGTNVTYAIAYASVAANAMAFNLHVILEAL